MPPWNFTAAGNWPPSCRNLWTASRPVNNVPVIATASPTFSARTAASETGVVSVIMSIQPFPDAALLVQRHALAPVGPAHVADADEVGGGQAVEHADFGAQQGGLAAKAHRADTEFVGGLHNILLQLVQFRIWVVVVQSAEKLLLGEFVARRPVAADAHPKDA